MYSTVHSAMTQHAFYRDWMEGISIFQLVSPRIGKRPGVLLGPQSTQSEGPVRSLIFCTISIFLLAIFLVADKRLWCTAGTD
jgi:hypothetical protein